jgi:hypothetical protein
MARRFGYETTHDLMVALCADRGTPAAEDLSTRWRDAMCRLFALKDATPDYDGPIFGAVVESLFVELPERLQRHPFMVKDGAIFEAA